MIAVAASLVISIDLDRMAALHHLKGFDDRSSCSKEIILCNTRSGFVAGTQHAAAPLCCSAACMQKIPHQLLGNETSCRRLLQLRRFSANRLVVWETMQTRAQNRLTMAASHDSIIGHFPDMDA